MAKVVIIFPVHSGNIAAQLAVAVSAGHPSAFGTG